MDLSNFVPNFFGQVYPGVVQLRNQGREISAERPHLQQQTLNQLFDVFAAAVGCAITMKFHAHLKVSPLQVAAATSIVNTRVAHLGVIFSVLSHGVCGAVHAAKCRDYVNVAKHVAIFVFAWLSDTPFKYELINRLYRCLSINKE